MVATTCGRRRPQRLPLTLGRRSGGPTLRPGPRGHSCDHRFEGQQLGRVAGVDELGGGAVLLGQPVVRSGAGRPGSTRSRRGRPGPGPPPRPCRPLASRVRQVWRSWWQVARSRPARCRAPRMITSTPSALSPVPRLGPFRATNTRSVDAVRGTLCSQVVAHLGEERVRDGDDPLAPALALGDEQRALGDLDVTEAQAEHLAAPEPTEHHGEDHGPVPVGAQGADQGLHVAGREDLGKRAGHPHQGGERRARRPVGGWKAPEGPGSTGPGCRLGPPGRSRSPRPRTTGGRWCVPPTPTHRR